ncbi:hypothetical protein OF376_00335 [Ureaplasma miroungigenitalium]|uniref:Uncharacterized protein n=1 Tax=Ureaplasma miroungigenitalium TaxID=1042321 RepID=A0ABT3BLW4_9BACT|nr:hypothetical protein [Ureaplasma miroungigenitalium]MCV3728237.1 hypothetical protein [Ureaplasma miroungigenitalium]
MKKKTKTILFSSLAFAATSAMVVTAVTAVTACSKTDKNDVADAVVQFNNVKKTLEQKYQADFGKEISDVIKNAEKEVAKLKEENSKNASTLIKNVTTKLEKDVTDIIKKCFDDANKTVSINFKNQSEILFKSVPTDLKAIDFDLKISTTGYQVIFVKAVKTDDKIIVSYDVVKNKDKQSFNKEILAKDFKTENSGELEKVNELIKVSFKNASEYYLEDITADQLANKNNFECTALPTDVSFAFIKAEKAADNSKITVTYKLSKKEQSKDFTYNILSSKFKQKVNPANPINLDEANKKVKVAFKDSSSMLLKNVTDAQLADKNNFVFSDVPADITATFVNAKKAADNSKIVVNYKLSQKEQSKEFTAEISTDSFKPVPVPIDPINFNEINQKVKVTFKNSSSMFLKDVTDAQLADKNNFEFTGTPSDITATFIKAEKAADNSKITVTYKLSSENEEKQVTKDIPAESNFKKEEETPVVTKYSLEHLGVSSADTITIEAGQKESLEVKNFAFYMKKDNATNANFTKIIEQQILKDRKTILKPSTPTKITALQSIKLIYTKNGGEQLTSSTIIRGGTMSKPDPLKFSNDHLQSYTFALENTKASDTIEIIGMEVTLFINGQELKTKENKPYVLQVLFDQPISNKKA